MRRIFVTLLMVACLASSAPAMQEDKSVVPHDRNPRAAMSAALLNIFFLPTRLITTFIGAEFAGITGFLTGGNEHAANDVFDIVNGSQVITPRMLEGKEPFHLSGYD